MFLHCGLFLMFLGCVRTTEDLYEYGLVSTVTELEQRFSNWPSVHNAMMRLQKRDAPLDTAGMNEGGIGVAMNTAHGLATLPATAEPLPVAVAMAEDKPKPNQIIQPEKTAVSMSTNESVISPSIAVIGNETNTNATTLQAIPKQLDLHDPGVLMRAIIVFGGFLLLAVAYYIFYRKSGKKNDNSNAHGPSDANQFRYGVLQSDDRRDNMELSRVPLTMESDDDDDEDLEIFDLEQKKKSLSYVNLQTNDEDVVFQNSMENNRGTDKDNLLLDIEDPASDTLINWSNNGNRSIL